MTPAFSSVPDLFAVDPVGEDLWRSRRGDPKGGRMYGGTLAAQLMSAARAATPGPPRVSSVDVRFVRPGDGGLPVDHHVERVQDGKSSAVRRVTVTQGAETIAIGTVGFHTPRDGWAHGGKPATRLPDSLAPTGTPHRSRAVTADEFDVRFYDEADDGGVVRRLWFRTAAALPPVVSVHECVVMYLSDIYFCEPICLEHSSQGNDRSNHCGTAQHAVWFHGAPRADEWLLIESRSPVLAGGRGLIYGEVRALDGSPVATVVQEAVVRLVDGDLSRGP